MTPGLSKDIRCHVLYCKRNVVIANNSKILKALFLNMLFLLAIFLNQKLSCVVDMPIWINLSTA